ncbi:hypothetical protein BGZ65_012573 [Modicella reniformis]|uniref:Uncharacterized protein n=1 Tax=Modicella reniformis TaxID=1440133 RepID=A0A9P6M1C4_9FUNG|nr:hypothetical protein BGZ65_012573 [Modicella reniformis]
MDDLRVLSNAVTKANVIHLTVEGIHFKNPALDVINQSQRYNPILKLASNSRLQYLQLRGFDDFFSRISRSSLVPAPRFRVLTMDLRITPKDKAIKSFNGFLQQCSSLTTLQVNLHHQYSITRATSDVFNKLQLVKSLKVDCGEFIVYASVSKGKIQDMDMTVKRLDNLSSDDFKFIKENHLKRLTIYHTPMEANKLADLLRCTPVLCRLQIGYEDERRFSAPILGIELQDLIKMIAPKTLSKFESLTIDYKRLSLTARFSQGQIQEMTMKIGRVDVLSVEDINFIQRGDFTRLVIEHADMADEGRLADIFRPSPVLSYIHIRRLGEPCLAKATTLDMKLHDLVKTITAETLDRNKSFLLNCQRLTLTAGLSQGRTQDMTMTIVQLSVLTSDDLIFIRQNQITWIVIETIPQVSDENRLADILRHCPALQQFHIRFKEERGLANTTAPELRLQDLVKMATADSLRNLDPLSIDYGRVTWTGSISKGQIQQMTVTFERLHDLTSDDIIFLQQGHSIRLAMRQTLQEADEDKLTNILHSIPGLTHLQIGCKSERFLAIVNSMITTREKLVQDRGSSSLRSIELMGGEDLAPFGFLGECHKDNTYMQSHLSFTEDSTTSFDMRTWIRLRHAMSITDRNPVNDFIRQYGWSIVLFDEDLTRNDTFAAILDDIPTTRDSQLESFRFHTYWFKADGFDRLDSIIKRSPNFKDLGLNVFINTDSGLKKFGEMECIHHSIELCPLDRGYGVRSASSNSEVVAFTITFTGNH